MAELSGHWTTTAGGTGHQQTSYTQAQLSTAYRVLAGAAGYEGVVYGLGSTLACTANGANTVRVATGGAMVDGKWYYNDANLDVNIPSAVGAGNTRIDRIVLRANWAGYKVAVTRIAGTDAGSPTAPAITQTSGTTYDIMLCRVLVTTAGTVTVTDERVYALPKSAPALSVPANRTNSAATLDYITAASDGAVLRRSGTSLGFGTITGAGIANDAINSQHYAAGSIDLEHMSADSVDDTKVGNRVPQFYRRQGGSSTDWSAQGKTTYTPTTVRMQAGVRRVSITSGQSTANELVSFPVAFSNKPIVFLTPNDGTAASMVKRMQAMSPATGTFSIFVDLGEYTGPKYLDVYWLAIGPE